VAVRTVGRVLELGPLSSVAAANGAEPALEMSGRFLSLHGTVGGRYDIALPRRCTVRDAEGQIIARDVTHFSADLLAQKT